MPRICIEPGCNRWPSYNYPNIKSRSYCKDHAKDGMCVVSKQGCIQPDCEKYALFNHPGEKKKLYCESHSKAGMINVKRRQCEYEGCSIQPYYNNPGETVGLYCAEHASDDMINVYMKSCLECEKYPSFNYKEEKYGAYCKQHSKSDMIDVRAKRCESCDKHATFAYIGTRTPIYCSEHKQENMFNVRKHACKYAGCTKTALFGKDIVEYCSEHRLDGMINLRRPICQADDCTVSPSYGFTKATHCSTHKEEGMSSMFGIRCKNCSKRATFNFKGKKPAVYCAHHRILGMVNLLRRGCITDNCVSYAVYGYPGNSLSYCMKHHPEGTIRKSTKICIVDDCDQLALYGKSESTHCDTHKLDTEFNLVEAICKSCKLLQVLDKDGNCKYCNPSAWKTVRLAKQREIQALFKAQNIDPVSSDTIIDGGICGHERPDFVFEGQGHCVVVEVDEDQHSTRSCECEQTRMVNISSSLGQPTIFLRYNPDPYKVNNKLCDTSKTTRYKTLINWVTKLLTLDSSELVEYGFVSVIQLYFDDYNVNNTNIVTLIPFDNLSD